ncbi:MAG: SprT family zinc-dependent metalloprotease [Gammaproteobacteria bacterium]
MTPDNLWPPVYTIKKHPRAKHVKLKASAQHGLELIVPPRFNLKHVPSILDENKSWILKQLLKLQQTAAEPKTDNLPDKIILSALNQTWHISYIASEVKLQIITRPHQEIVLLGKIQNKLHCKKLLIAWIKQIAKTNLAIQLKRLSEKINLPYSKLTIRDQKTRWGSCTTKKSISLNYKLLFLPQPLAEHILIHELCHTVQLNHSEKFWRLVEKFDPDCENNRRAVRKVDAFIPEWID